MNIEQIEEFITRGRKAQEDVDRITDKLKAEQEQKEQEVE